MDDQRPMSGGEKAFFSLGTGSGIFVVYFYCKFLKIPVFLSACCAYLYQV
jgi:hypothetical protein